MQRRHRLPELQSQLARFAAYLVALYNLHHGLTFVGLNIGFVTNDDDTVGRGHVSTMRGVCVQAWLFLYKD